MDEKNKQDIEIIQGEDYEDLVRKIRKEIIFNEKEFYVQQIDYFAMDDKDSCRCTAIILFRQHLFNR
jgi:hypothetical protein